MRVAAVIYLVVVLSIIGICVGGCSKDYLDPTQIGRFRAVPAVNVILDSLGVAEEESPIYAGAQDPRPIDVIVFEEDYVFQPGDSVRVFIFEMLQENIMFVNDFTVTETGKISIPEVGAIQAEGLTEAQLEEEIKQILSPTILKEPTVTVILQGSESHVFSILGDGVARPGRYGIPRYNFRLTDALAVAGSVRQFNVSYIYVSRAITGREALTEQLIDIDRVAPQLPSEIEDKLQPKPPEPDTRKPPYRSPEEEMLEIITPQVSHGADQNATLITSAEMITEDELQKVALPEGFDSLGRSEEPDVEDLLAAKIYPGSRENAGRSLSRQDTSAIEWIYQDGKWVPMRIGPPKEPELLKQPPFREEPTAPIQAKKKELEGFGWEEIGTAGVQTRVIKIPVDKLFGGDPRYDIVVRPGDAIMVPVDIVGEFYVMGNTNYVGPIYITGRPMTLKMAIAAAGGLGPLASPRRLEVIRRIGKNREEIVLVDLDKIARGLQPDFFIKPDDLINVGTHPNNRWLAVLRNAFRATYGFGFIYDRNFADRDFGTRRPIPDIF